MAANIADENPHLNNAAFALKLNTALYNLAIEYKESKGDTTAS